jgi:hypothetical protein
MFDDLQRLCHNNNQTKPTVLILKYGKGGHNNKADVNLAVIPNLNNDGRKALIELINRGSGATTNLSLTIQTPKKISSITNEFSSTDITIPKFNNFFISGIFSILLLTFIILICSIQI